MKRRRVQTPEQKKYGKKMRRRKTGLYAVLILSFLIALVISTLFFWEPMPESSCPRSDGP